MPTTLLTGGTGFVGATVLDTLLKHGHDVVLAVRSLQSAKAFLESHDNWDASKVALSHVPDFTEPGAFDVTFKEHPDIDYIIHVAAPVFDDPGNTDFVEHFEKPSILGNAGLLESAMKYGKNVKAVAVTGSVNAMTTGDPADLDSRVMGNDQWLPLGREDAIKMQNAYIFYCVGKKVAEETLWKFVKEKKPAFAVTNFMPPLIFGPMLQNVSGVDKLNFSSSQFFSIMESGKKGGVVPSTGFPGYIDVRDLAELHIKALTTPEAANRRFVVGYPMKYDDFADALRKSGELEGWVGTNNGETAANLRLETSDTNRVFNHKYRSLDETAMDTANSILKVIATAK